MYQKPDFIIIGVSKAGTTSLHNLLSQHKDIHMSKVKEPNFYLKEYKEKINGTNIQIEENYFELFSKDKISGESSVSYFDFIKETNLLKDNPKRKIILIIRDPSTRLLSDYQMKLRRGENYNNIQEYYNSINYLNKKVIDFGFYYENIKYILETFKENQRLILFFEELENNQIEVLSKIYNFLKIDYQMPIDIEIKNKGYILKYNFLNYYFILIKKTKLKEKIKKIIKRDSYLGIILRKTEKYILNNLSKKDENEKYLKEIKEIYKEDLLKTIKILKEYKIDTTYVSKWIQNDIK